MVQWLNTAFYGFDNSMFYFVHDMAKVAGGFFTPFFSFITLFGEKGLFFIVLSVALMLFKKTRRVGIAMLIAIGVGVLFSNLVIKKLVSRPRPYAADEVYMQFNELVGGKREKDFSFPSGHSTIAMTVMMAMFLTCNKKWSWVGFVLAFLMGLSRIYFVVHYTTDVIGGLAIGAISGTIAYFIVKGIYKAVKKHQQNGFCKFMLNADLIEAFRKCKAKK